MAVPVERGKASGTCFLKVVGGRPEMMGEILTEKQTPCYLLQEEECIYKMCISDSMQRDYIQIMAWIMKKQ